MRLWTFLVALLLVGCTNQPPGSPEEAVRYALDRSDTKAYQSVNIRADGTTIQLTGTVPWSFREKAEYVALRALPKGSSVINNLVELPKEHWMHRTDPTPTDTPNPLGQPLGTPSP